MERAQELRWESARTQAKALLKMAFLLQLFMLGPGGFDAVVGWLCSDLRRDGRMR
jgi:hypothetical protein